MNELALMNNEWAQMLFRFLFNLFFIGILIKIINHHSKEISRHISTFFIISVIVFFLCFTLKQVDLNFGMALGLFAIFGIIRYRTEAVLPEEITYLFVTIGLSVINALTIGGFGWLTLIIINVAVCLSVLFAEKYLLHADDIYTRNKIIVNLPLDEKNMCDNVNNAINNITKEHNISVQNHNIFKIDYESKIIQVHLFYNKNTE
ncbi:MAG: hypothetical protein ACI914_000603 [Candidatus Marivariicella framensis]|jgi:hypothetical protein|tara:strand:+ start:235 stop:846 length:612 start_codon:yes stop_codon:yes gene_type:complete